MGATVVCKCSYCKTEFTAKVADRKRGWARFCSKSCKAKQQERRTGQYKAITNGLGDMNYMASGSDEDMSFGRFK